MIATDQFCSIHEKNKSTFSNEYAQIIMLSAVHFESCAKVLADKYGGTIDNKKNVGTIREFLMESRCGLASLKLKLFPSMRVIQPLGEWADGTKTNWWSQYTSIKHNFETARELATQEVALNALSGCLVILLYLLEDKFSFIHPHSKLIVYERPRYLVDTSSLELP